MRMVHQQIHLFLLLTPFLKIHLLLPIFAIPDHMTWTVTMWHFGADALITYEGQKIYTSWEVGQHALITAYAKDYKDGKSRIEKQE
jgi:hypothetical protein